MVPGKLKRHLDSQPFTLKEKSTTFFSRLFDQPAKQTWLMSDYTSISFKGMEASFLVSQLIEQCKQPHTIAESLVTTCCRETLQSMLGESAAKEIQKIPLSDNTVSRCINNMADDILEQLRDKLLESKLFSILLDESTDIKGKCQLLANVNLLEVIPYREVFFFCRELPARQLELKYTIQQQNFWKKKCCSGRTV